MPTASLADALCDKGLKRIAGQVLAMFAFSPARVHFCSIRNGRCGSALLGAAAALGSVIRTRNIDGITVRGLRTFITELMRL